MWRFEKSKKIVDLLNNSLNSQIFTMRKQILLGLFLIGFSFVVTAQTAVLIGENAHKQVVNTQAKLATGQSLTISPNPLPRENALLTVNAVGLTYYSYIVLKSNGQIVELENLSGKPDANYIDLNGAVIPGFYVIVFDTDAGKVTRKFNVF